MDAKAIKILLVLLGVLVLLSLVTPKILERVFRKEGVKDEVATLPPREGERVEVAPSEREVGLPKEKIPEPSLKREKLPRDEEEKEEELKVVPED